MVTPYDKLKSLPHAEHYLKPNVLFESLDAMAHFISDNDAAQQPLNKLNEAKLNLLNAIFEQK